MSTDRSLKKAHLRRRTHPWTFLSDLPVPRVFRNHTVSGEGGLTLVELLLSLALTGMVMAMTVPFAHLQKRLWERQEEQREAGRALAGSLAWLTRDLQQAGYHDPGFPLRQVAPELLSYVVSRDEGDPTGFSTANRRLITLWRDGADLKYKIQAPLAPSATGWASGSTQVLASGISSMHCRGLDGGGEETTAAAEVALVDCALSGAAGMQERAVVRLRCGTRVMGP